MSETVPHNREELAKLLEIATGAKSVLEVGSRYGYVLGKIARVMGGKGRIVSVDLPGGPWGAKSQGILLRNVEIMRSEGHEVHLFLGDSRDREIVEQVRKLGPFDFVFIDADHSYDASKEDWKNYGAMGKTVVFHDIVMNKQKGMGVWRLWEEIEGNKEEFVAYKSKMGIGIWRASDPCISER